MKAVVLAGQPNSGALGNFREPWEALVPVLGRPMVEYVVDALLAACSVDGVVVVGPASERPGVRVVEPGSSVWDNLAAGVAALAASEETARVLVATADIPLLTPAAVDALVAAGSDDVDVVYPVVPKAVCDAQLPGTRRTYVRLREGLFTGGNLFMLNPSVLERVRTIGERLVGHRKSPRQLARDVGAGILFKFMLGRLALGDIEERVAQRFGVRGKAVVFPYAEVGVDIDKPSDLSLAERALGRGRPAVAKGLGG